VGVKWACVDVAFYNNIWFTSYISVVIMSWLYIWSFFLVFVMNLDPVQADDCGGRHFDAASFIGGIILAFGVAFIVFFAVRYWQARRRGTV
jgi:hypothetical protein